MFLSDIMQKGYLLADGVGDKLLSIQVRDADKKELDTIFRELLDSADLQMRDLESIAVIEPKTDKLESLIYHPKNRDNVLLGELVQAAFPLAVLGNERSVSNVPQSSDAPPITGNKGSSALFDRSDKHVLIVRAPINQHGRIRQFLEDLDSPVPQLLISGVSYEVSTSKGEGRAIDIVASIFSDKFGVSLLSGASALAGVFSSVSFSGLNVQAVIAALDEDSRFRSLSKPSVRVRSGGIASFNVGSDVPVLGSVTTEQGTATQSVDYRSSGVLLDVEPVVMSDSIDLKLKQEFSNFVKTDTGLSSTPTLNKRLIRTELNVKSGEWLLIGGLQDSQQTEGESRFPFFGLPLGKSRSERDVETILILEVQRL